MIAFGGKYSDAINVFDIHRNRWQFVGRMASQRYGSYALLNEYENLVYIVGGVNEKEDNSLDIEYFRLTKNLDSEIMVKKLKDDYLLRRVNPVIIPIFDFNTYIICGGAGMWGDVDTCVFYYTDKDTVVFSNNTLPKPISSENHNVHFYKEYVYFFTSNVEVMKYSGLDNSYSVISRKSN